MAFQPYLAFAGNCREAFTCYQEVFGGELVLLSMGDLPSDGTELPPEAADLIGHAALTVGDELLMGADAPPGAFEGGGVRGMCVNRSMATSVGEAERVFAALSEGGEVQMPMAPTFYSPAFGMCTDRFGTPWMIMVEDAELQGVTPS